jgi:GntR family transcriptional regulator/MocR family aminotransferase
VLEQATLHRLHIDRQGDHALEHAIAELIEDGELGRHARRMRRIYQVRRDTLVDALEKKLGSALSVSTPSGGMALWTRAAPGIDVDAWAERARARALIVHPARQFAFDRRSRPALRLGFAALDERELETAVTRLADAL